MNNRTNLRDRFPVLSHLDREDIKFSNVPQALQLEFAKIIDPDGHGWKIMAENLGFPPRDINFFATLKDNMGSNTLNVFKSYETKKNSLKVFCEVMVDCGYQDVLEELSHRWNDVLTIHRNSMRLPEEHAVNSYPEHCHGVSCTYMNCKPHSGRCENMESVSPTSARYQSDPTSAYRKCAEPCEHISHSLPPSHVDASISEETRYTFDTHNRVQNWLQSNPHPSNSELQKAAIAKGKFESTKNKHKLMNDKMKPQKSQAAKKGRENAKNSIKLESMETSMGTDSSGHQSMETSGSSTDNNSPCMGIKSEKSDGAQQGFGIATEAQSIYFRQGQPMNPGNFVNLPPFQQAFSPSATQQQAAMAQRHFSPNHNIDPYSAQPDYQLSERLQHHPNPGRPLAQQGSQPLLRPAHVHKPTPSPPVHGLQQPRSPLSGYPAVHDRYKPRSVDVSAAHPGAGRDNFNPLGTVPYGNVYDPMETQISNEHKNEKKTEKDNRAQAISTCHSKLGPTSTGSEPNIGCLSLKGPQSQRFGDEPRTSYSGSFESIKYSMSSEGRIESGPFADSLRAASLFVTHLFGCWENFAKEKHYSKCALSLSRCLRENNFRVQMDVPKVNNKCDENSKRNPWADDSCWREWLDRKFASVNYILVCLSPAYLQVVNATHIEDTVDIQDNIMSTRYIFHLMQHEFEESRTGNRRFIPILFDDIPQNQIPNFLQNSKVYRWTSDFEDLLWRLNQPEQQVTNILANQQG